MNRFRFIVPNFFTSLSLLSAMASLNYIAKEEYILSSWFIFLSMMFDFLDGRIARRLDAMSSFGALYDTMTDFVAFGIVPGLLIYRTTLININPWGAVIAVIYVFSGCYRLIRFTLRSGDPSRKSTFIGLPIPVASGFIAAFIIINITLWQQLPDAFSSAVIVIALSFLMVSRVQYLAVNEKGKLSLSVKVVFCLVPVSIILFFRNSHIVFLFWISVYIIFNPLRHLYLRVFKSRSNYTEKDKSRVKND